MYRLALFVYNAVRRSYSSQGGKYGLIYCRIWLLLPIHIMMMLNCVLEFKSKVHWLAVWLLRAKAISRRTGIATRIRFQTRHQTIDNNWYHRRAFEQSTHPLKFNHVLLRSKFNIVILIDLNHKDTKICLFSNISSWYPTAGGVYSPIHLWFWNEATKDPQPQGTPTITTLSYDPKCRIWARTKLKPVGSVW